jgi:hypothetical protein
MFRNFQKTLLLLGILLPLILLVALRPLLAFQADEPEPPDTSWRFGVIESYEAPDQADRLDVGWTRVPFHWAKVQSGGEDTWEPEISQEQLESEIAAGRMIVGLLIGIPEWAAGDDGLPSGLWLDHEDPANTWANYVRQAATTYAGQIDHWIIWNEPDIPETEIAHSWDGSVADFAQLQRVAYLAAKEANPEAVIHLPAFTYWADYYAGTEQYMARLLDEIAADPLAAEHNYYFDVATAHLYFQPGQIYDLLRLFSAILRERGLNQPIWLAETNAPPRDDPAWPVTDWTLSVIEVEQAAYMPQALAAGLAAGAERIAVYKLKDTESDKAANPEPFGLVRLDGSERMSFATYRLAIDYLDGALGAERERWDEIGQIRVDQVEQSTTVLFSRLPEWQQAEVTATADLALLIDMWGTKQVITPTEGLYTVDLPPASCSHSIGEYCMIGGYTHYLVQEADTPPPTPTPTPTETPAITPTVTPADTPAPTETPASTALPASTSTATSTATATTQPAPSPTPVPPTQPPPTASLAASEPAESASDTPGVVDPPIQDDRAPIGLIVIGAAAALILVLIWLARRQRV